MNNHLDGLKERKYQDNRGKICSVLGCNNIARAKGLCMKCYSKMRKKEKKDE